MQTPSSLGIAHFLSQTDAVGIFLFVLLLLMSVLSWTLIISRLRSLLTQKQRSAEFSDHFRLVSEFDDLRRLTTTSGQQDTQEARLAKAALEAIESYRDIRGAALIAVESPSELVIRSLQQSVDEESARMEHGQTSLASVASSAPFVGLFGTVWGIYHALITIGSTGQSSLDQVAGPVGEALIMTALGLAVAIPAALAYNAFQRQTRIRIARLERFAHEIFLRLATGAQERR